MRYPAAHKAETRRRIIHAAARHFRSRGTEGAAIADLMHDLELTHGGFYRHFRSKEDLLAAVITYSVADTTARVKEAADRVEPRLRLKVIIDTYLSAVHCGQVADGCPVAALAPELGRRSARVRGAFHEALVKHAKTMAEYMPGSGREARERTAIMLFSGMAGTLAVARALPDDRERARMLSDAKQFYLDAVVAVS